MLDITVSVWADSRDDAENQVRRMRAGAAECGLDASHVEALYQGNPLRKAEWW